MMMLPHFLRQYKNIIVWDFEFASIGGEIKPTSVAYKNILRKNSKTQFKWLRKTDGSVIDGIPYDFEDLPLDDDEATLFVSFFGEAEYSCVKELGWELFEHDHIDCYSEIKILKNGLWNSFSLANIADKLGFDAGVMFQRLQQRLVEEVTQLMYMPGISFSKILILLLRKF